MADLSEDEKRKVWQSGAKVALDECMSHLLSGCDGCLLYPPRTRHGECPFEYAQDWLARQAGEESGNYPGWIRSDEELRRALTEWKEKKCTPIRT